VRVCNGVLNAKGSPQNDFSLFPKLHGTISWIQRQFYLESTSMRIVLVGVIMMKEVRVTNLFIYKLLVIVMRLIYATILAWFITGILLIPLNYYIIHTADNTESKTMYLEIRGLIARPRNNKIYYELNGAMNILNGERKIMNEVYQRQNYKDYQLKMVVHEAMFGVLIIEDWDIVKRT